MANLQVFQFPAAEAACSPVSGRARRKRSFREQRTASEALEQRGAHSQDFQGSVPARRLALLQAAQLPNTLAILGEKICPMLEAFKAWSQNLGHSHVLTTFMNYGTVA